jgi:hypothetical protein
LTPEKPLRASGTLTRSGLVFFAGLFGAAGLPAFGAAFAAGFATSASGDLARFAGPPGVGSKWKTTSGAL